MPLTNSLKPLLDIPTWEWAKFAPSNWDTNRPLTTSGDGLNRYLYGPNFISTTSYAYRYDTHSDAWQQMAQSVLNATNNTAVQYTRHIGYAFRALSSASATVVGALLDGEHLKGATLRVVEGTGAGQERTVTAVGEPVVAQRGYATAVNQNNTQASWIRDTNKNWTINQWVGYQLRLTLNSGAGILRRIIYNDANTLYFYDPAWSSHSPYEWGAYILQTLSVASGTQTTYAIESATATLDSPWDTQLDKTSMVMAKTGAMWMISGNSATPFFTLQYYDVLADVWQVQAAQQYMVGGNLPEATLERMGDWAAAYATGTATGSSTSTVLTADGSPGWATDRWANFQVCITGGTGRGQCRTITTSSASALTVAPPFTVTPDATSTFEITADKDKLYYQHSGDARLKQFSIRAQQWVHSRIADYGVVRTLSATLGSYENPLEGFPVTSITRAGTTATVTTGINHNLATGDTVTIAGATGVDASLYNGSFVITVTGLTTFTYTMAGTPTGNATSNALSTTVLVDATKNWTVNEHVGKSLQWAAGTGYAQNINGMAVITANTANTITVATAGTLPVNGQTYAITDGPAFGYDNTVPGASTNGTGLATGGSTTTLVDSTKNWATNEHVGKILFTSAGTGLNQLLTITANTNNTITFGAANTPAANTRYSILPVNNRGSGLQLKWIGYPSNTAIAGRYIFSFRGGNTLQVDRYDICTQQWRQLALQNSELLNTGSMYVYDGVDKIYFHVNATNKISVLDINTLKTDLYGQAPYAQGAAAAGNRLEIVCTSDGLKFLYLTRHGGTEMWRTLLFL